jgi:hypothetical protein
MRDPFPLLLLLASTVIATSAGAAAPTKPFEGTLDMHLTMETGSGELRLYMSGDRAKLDMHLNVNPLPEPLELAVLLDAKTPRTAFLVNDKAKSWSAVDLDAQHMPPDSLGGKYVIKDLGTEKILGHECRHVTLTRHRELVDAWVTQDLPEVYGVVKRLQEANPQLGGTEAFRALDASGKSGLPLRCIVVQDGQRVTTEVRRIERGSQSPSLFVVPKDYKQSDAAAAAGLQPTPAQVEEMKKVIEGALQGQ